MAQAGSGRRTPRWAVLLAAFGALLMLASGGALVAAELTFNRIDGAIREGDLFGGDSENYGEDIRGPLNILLAGLDTRPSRPDETPRADAIMIVHVDRDLQHGYMISIPRDALVDIPPFPETGYLGGRDRINSAMFHGANPIQGEETPDVERGFALLANTVSQLTGIEDFDAGVVLNFVGFEDIVDAMGGLSVTLNETIISEHRLPDGKHRPLIPGGGGYSGEQMVYEPGAPPCGPERDNGSFTCELNGWQALDVVRQRKSLADGDYGRQDNQQKVLESMMSQAFSRDLVTNPGKLDNVLQAVGDSMIFDGRGNRVVDFGFALKDLRPDAMAQIGLRGDSVGVGSGYQGEELRPEAYDLFEAIRQGQVDQFLAEHPDFTDGDAGEPSPDTDDETAN